MESGRSASPILDGYSLDLRTPRLDLPATYPEAAEDPCAMAGHDHTDRRGGVDLPCALAGWFLARVGPCDGLYLWTGTHDPKRFFRRSEPTRLFVERSRRERVHDRVGQALAASAADLLYERVRAEDPQVSVLYGIEQHKSGARHAHALWATHGDFRWKGLHDFWFGKYGADLWERVRQPEAAARYSGKYITKEELGIVKLAFAGGRFG